MMANFAKLMTVVGIVMADLSALLLGYLEPGSAEYTLSQIDIFLGILLFAFGLGYLLLKSNRNK